MRSRRFVFTGHVNGSVQVRKRERERESECGKREWERKRMREKGAIMHQHVGL